MRYVSTRGATEPLSFQDAVLTGLAPDGGLLVPESIPDVTADLERLASLDFVDLAKAVVGLFVDDIPEARLGRLIDDAYRRFDIDEVVRLETVDGVQVLELFHGPTLAFKDVALQLLGKFFEHILAERDLHLNVLCATSGDTGSAAIAGVQGQPNIDIFVMYPHGRVSPLQELQMTTINDPNVHCLAVEGSFDDCQSLLKAVFNDLDFKHTMSMAAVNSVNWARVLAQIVYYGYASLKSAEPVSFCVPTGNFGNVFAGYLAKRMGFPIDRLIVATNENDILAVFFETGVYRRGQVRYTISPAMDIQVASNFERFLYYHLGEDAAALTAFMDEFQASGEARLAEPPGDEVFLATAVDTDDTLAAIRSVFEETGYLADPHTAVGLSAARRLKLDGQIVCIATAHPAKFPESVDAAVGKPLARHPRLEALRDLPAERTVVRPDVAAIKSHIVDPDGRAPQVP